MPLVIGQVLNNRYRVVRLLGQGGFGAVYRAWDTNLGEAVAIKENLDTSPEAERQFQSETRILFKLRFPILPAVHDYFTIPGQGQYLVMDYVEGQDLQVKLSFSPAGSMGLPVDQVLDWILQVCEAVQYLHQQIPPVIHRDIKPANIRITPQGKACLVDFGIAKAYDPSRSTTTGARAVTPGFSPLEQYGQGGTGMRSDVYSLGATLYTLLTGVVPPSPVDVVAKAVLPPKPAHKINSQLSTDLSKVIEKAMQIYPNQRYDSVKDFAAELRKAQQAYAISTRRPNLQAAPAQSVIIAASVAPTIPRPVGSTRRYFNWQWIAAGVFAILLLTLAGLFLSGGYAVLPESASEATSTSYSLIIRPSETINPLAKKTTPSPARHTLTATKTLLPPSPTPSPTYSLPVMAGTPIPAPDEPITVDNANKIVQLARWGKGQVNEVVFSPDGRYLVVGTSVGVYLYDSKDLEEIRFIDAGGWVTSAAISPDSKIIATAIDGDYAVTLWQVSDGSIIRKLIGHTWNVKKVAFSPDGQILASGSSDYSVRLWQVSDGNLLRTLNHSRAVNSLAFSPDGQRIAVSANGGAYVMLWRISDGYKEQMVKGFSTDVGPLAFSPNGKQIVATDMNGKIYLWQVIRESQPRFLRYGGNPAFSPDGTILAIALYTGIDLLNTEDLRLIKSIENPGSNVSFSPDGQTLAYSSSGQMVRLYNLMDYQEQNIVGFMSYLQSLVFSPDNLHLASAEAGQTSYWRLSDGIVEQALEWVNDNYKVSARCLAFSPDGQIMAAGSYLYDTGIGLFRTSDGQLERTLPAKDSSIYSLAFSPDGHFLASGSDDNRVNLWRITDGSLVKTLNGHRAAIQSLAFSPDGQLLASAGSYGEVIVWRVEDGSWLYTLDGGSESLAFSPDGNLLVTACGTSVCIWQASDGTLIRYFEGHEKTVTSIALSPDGKIVASGSEDQTVRLWNISDGTLLATMIASTSSMPGYSPGAISVAFSSDGRYIASGAEYGAIYIWGIAP